MNMRICLQIVEKGLPPTAVLATATLRAQNIGHQRNWNNLQLRVDLAMKSHRGKLGRWLRVSLAACGTSLKT